MDVVQLVRTLDPLCEPFVRTTAESHVVFDHCSYLVRQVEDPLRFHHVEDNARKVRGATVTDARVRFSDALNTYSSGTGCTITWTSLHP